MMSNKEKIAEYMKKNEGIYFQASEIASVLNIKRNAASALLNEMEREHFLVKRKTRPVLFCYKKENKVEEEQQEKDPFSGYIGYDRSLKREIDKCRIAATYPGRGFPLMLLGESGTGKSMLAHYVYKYSKRMNIISETAPFVVLNCADYSNNKELLSATLFGYNKGAFTGAVKDTEGLFEKADNGYLFLDEVHRLSEEGQEKLFRYMDYGTISRVGGGEEKKVNVHLIFATTENVNAIMLETFMRRIPLTVQISPFSKRSYGERLDIIKKLFYLEGQTLGYNLKIDNRVIEWLIGFQGKGNVGTLRNKIKILCAKAYHKNSNKEVVIKYQDLDFIEGEGNYFSQVETEWTTVNISEEFSHNGTIQKLPLSKIGDTKRLLEKIELFNKNKIGIQKWRQCLSDYIEQLSNYFYNNNIYDEIIYCQAYAGQVLKELEESCGIHSGKQQIDFLSCIVMYMNQDDEITGEVDGKLFRVLNKRIPVAFKLADNFIQKLKEQSQYKNHTLFGKIVTGIYFYLMSDTPQNITSSMIIMHGKGIASGMAGLVNYIYSKYIFEYIEVDMKMQYTEVKTKLKKWLKKQNTEQGVLLLIDLGALSDLKDEVKDLVQGDFAVISNVSTRIALETGGQLLKGTSMRELLDHVKESGRVQVQYIEKKEKQHAILICCISGIGTAVKIGKMLSDCLKKSSNIKVIAYEYGELKKYGMNSAIFQEYKVLFVVTTIEFTMEEIPVILLNDLIDQKGQETISKALGQIMNAVMIKSFMNEMVKSFSMKNIISQLSILNPERIIEDVDMQLSELERYMGQDLPINIKKMLMIHISIMVERLMRGPEFVLDEIDTKFKEEHQDFVFMVEKSFSVIEEKYNVSINIREIRLIYDLCTYK